jgi:CheY-like chemotaxis protein
MNSLPSGIKRAPHDAIEVHLWEIYLLRNRCHLSKMLSVYSINKAELSSVDRESAKISLSFTLLDWNRSIKAQLSEHAVPYEIVRIYKTEIERPVEKKKVYVAEDDLDILFALNTMLEDAGYDVLMSHCGAPILNENLPSTDLFILDNKMPDFTGIDLCRHLKSRSNTKHIPVIMISAFRNNATQALKAGVDDYLEKPFQMKDLLKLVEKHTAAAS